MIFNFISISSGKNTFWYRKKIVINFLVLWKIYFSVKSPLAQKLEKEGIKNVVPNPELLPTRRAKGERRSKENAAEARREERKSSIRENVKWEDTLRQQEIGELQQRRQKVSVTLLYCTTFRPNIFVNNHF